MHIVNCSVLNVSVLCSSSETEGSTIVPAVRHYSRKDVSVMFCSAVGCPFECSSATRLLDHMERVHSAGGNTTELDQLRERAALELSKAAPFRNLTAVGGFGACPAPGCKATFKFAYSLQRHAKRAHEVDPELLEGSVIQQQVNKEQRDAYHAKNPSTLAPMSDLEYACVTYDSTDPLKFQCILCRDVGAKKFVLAKKSCAVHMDALHGMTRDDTRDWYVIKDTYKLEQNMCFQTAWLEKAKCLGSQPVAVDEPGHAGLEPGPPQIPPISRGVEEPRAQPKTPSVRRTQSSSSGDPLHQQLAEAGGPEASMPKYVDGKVPVFQVKVGGYASEWDEPLQTEPGSRNTWPKSKPGAPIIVEGFVRYLTRYYPNIGENTAIGHGTQINRLFDLFEITGDVGHKWWWLAVLRGMWKDRSMETMCDRPLFSQSVYWGYHMMMSLSYLCEYGDFIADVEEMPTVKADLTKLKRMIVEPYLAQFQSGRVYKMEQRKDYDADRIQKMPKLKDGTLAKGIEKACADLFLMHEQFVSTGKWTVADKGNANCAMSFILHAVQGCTRPSKSRED